MGAHFRRLLFALAIVLPTGLSGQDVPRLKPLPDILADLDEDGRVQELEQRLGGDRLYIARRCGPLLYLLGAFLGGEEGQEESAAKFVALGEQASELATRVEAERDREAVEEIRVLAEAIGYRYAGRLSENMTRRGHYFEGDEWIEGDVAFCAERIPVLLREAGGGGGGS